MKELLSAILGNEETAYLITTFNSIYEEAELDVCDMDFSNADVNYIDSLWVSLIENFVDCFCVNNDISMNSYDLLIEYGENITLEYPDDEEIVEAAHKFNELSKDIKIVIE